ncbi:tetratricopeptide repeat protein [Tundrisphaera sp. TA3]|uniref:tetratricopeptide repeat protein n=1 Tax=Tundrisphaera sp. TA3 TaxID=3435775 RepID=UPI003EBA89C8
MPAETPASGATSASRLVDAFLVAAFLGLAFLLGAFPLKDTDFWWHLKAGDMIRQTGEVPRVDTLTYGAEGHPWVDLHWLFQVLISWGFGRFGVPGLTLAKCAITTAAVALLISARRKDWPVWAMVLAWVPALFVLGGRMYIRPETLTLLYLSAYLAVLFRWERWPALAFVLPAVQVLWVNTQGLFLLGPILMGFALVDAAIRRGALSPERRPWWRTVGIATALVGVACLVNPYGLAGALYPLQLAGTMSTPIFKTTIAELEPIPSFIGRSGLTSLPLCIHLFAMVLGAASFVIPLLWSGWVRLADRRAALEPAPAPEPPPKKRGKKGDAQTKPRGKKGKQQAPAEPPASWGVSPFRFFLYASFSALSLAASRNSHQFAAVVGTVTAWNFGEWAAAIRARRLRLRPDAPSWPVGRRLAVLGVVGAAIGLVASGQFYAWAGEGRIVGLGEEKLWFPHEATRFAGRPDMPDRLVAYHNGLPSLYEYYFGPERKVYTDARLEVMGPEVYSQYIALGDRIGGNLPGWSEELVGMGRPAVMLDTIDARIAGKVATLLAARRWHCVWFDPIVAVFVHDSYSSVIREHGVDFLARHYRREAGAAPADPAALAAMAKSMYNVAAQLRSRPGNDALARSMVLLGLDYSRRLRAVAPGDLEGWKRAGVLELLRDPLGTEGVIPRFRLPFDPTFDISLARSTYALRRTVEAAPDDGLPLLSLGNSFVLRGMNEPALPLIERFAGLPARNEYQKRYSAQAPDMIARIRADLGAKPATTWSNLGDLERVVSALLATGWAETAADVMENAYKPEARSWEWADRLAILRLHLGRPDRARAAWLAVGESAPAAVRSARVAMTYLVEDDFEAARRAYAEALAADPKLFEAHFGLAVLEQDAGHADEALAAAKRAEANAPNDHSRIAARELIGAIAPAVPGQSLSR